MKLTTSSGFFLNDFKVFQKTVQFFIAEFCKVIWQRYHRIMKLPRHELCIFKINLLKWPT